MRLDKLDADIVRLLQEDARLSFRELAARLGSTTPTVSARVKALEDICLIQGYRAQVDATVLGGSSHVVIATVQPQTTAQAMATLQAMQGVQRVNLLAGARFVMHVTLRPPALSLSHLHEAMAAVPGLVSYEASQVIAGHQANGLQDLPENVDVACHQCQGPIHGEPVKGKFGNRSHVFCCRQCLGTFRERFESLSKPPAKAKAPSQHGTGPGSHGPHHH